MKSILHCVVLCTKLENLEKVEYVVETSDCGKLVIYFAFNRKLKYGTIILTSGSNFITVTNTSDFKFTGKNFPSFYPVDISCNDGSVTQGNIGAKVGYINLSLVSIDTFRFSLSTAFISDAIQFRATASLLLS